jgi:hypothetical protein
VRAGVMFQLWERAQSLASVAVAVVFQLAGFQVSSWPAAGPGRTKLADRIIVRKIKIHKNEPTSIYHFAACHIRFF